MNLFFVQYRARKISMAMKKKTTFHGFPVHVFALNRITVESFQENWSGIFLEETGKLAQVFQGLKIDFYHVGSTSVPGCAAKPIIDILGVTPDVILVDKYNASMTGLGYEPMGEYGMEQRRFFRKKHGVSVNLHIFEDTDPEVERHLRFRNYLRAHPEKTKEYSQLKESLARQFPGDITRYILGKQKWIKEIDILAAQSASEYLCKKSCKRKKDWSSGQILKAMEVNMHLQMTYFAKYISSIEQIFQPDATVIRSEISDDTFNFVLSARFTDANVRERIAHVSGLYEKPKHPFSWWVGPNDAPGGLSDALFSQGFAFKEENIGMHRRLDDFIPPSKNHELGFVRIATLSQLKDFSEVIASIGGSSSVYKTIYSKLPPILYKEGSSFEMHVAYLNRVPIVTGILVLHANVGGIYYVTTVPDQRKKGYGTAMMEHLLRTAKSKGYHVATLQASRAGKNLYEHMGFKACCQFKEYVRAME
jgi:GrpB-like predicted nucleotidyltransferase (UPF0157 family)/ribosomal protein S18 acetylase RimI-like enzyme